MGDYAAIKHFLVEKKLLKSCSPYTPICTKETALNWLFDDIDKFISCIETTSIIKGAYDKCSNFRKAILISMAYQMGCSKLSTFKKTLQYMEEEKWDEVSEEMLDSVWAKNQTQKRAKRHSKVIKYNNCENIMDICSYYGW